MTSFDARDRVAAWGELNLDALQEFQAATIDLRDCVQAQVNAGTTDDDAIAEIAHRGAAPALTLLTAAASGDPAFDEAISLTCTRWIAATELMNLTPHFHDQAERDAAIAEARAALGGLAMAIGRMVELGFRMPGM